MTLQTLFTGIFLATTIAAWLMVQRERIRNTRMQKEHRQLKVRHQHALHLITVLQARLAARDAGPGQEPRWLPRP